MLLPVFYLGTPGYNITLYIATERRESERLRARQRPATVSVTRADLQNAVNFYHGSGYNSKMRIILILLIFTLYVRYSYISPDV